MSNDAKIGIGGRSRLWNSGYPLWALALVLGAVQAWANRFYMGNDGISYLDMADAYLRKDWHTAVNASWNPLYAWLVGLSFGIFRPSSYWEYPTVQLTNFGIYVLTVACFEYFLRGLVPQKDSSASSFRIVGYAVFLWSTLILIRVWTVNGDMLVAAFCFLAVGLLVRARNPKTRSPRTAVLLGVTLALGYYTKAAMLPLALLALCIATLLMQWRLALIATAVFALLSAPLIVAVSKATGHITFGDTGRVNYAWYVNGVQPRYWQGGPASAGKPQHAPRIALDAPRVYEFGGVFPEVTYPIWYDFAYWYEGLSVHVDVRDLVTVSRRNVKAVLKLLLLQGLVFLSGLAVCAIFDNSKGRLLKRLCYAWPVLLVGIAGITMYCALHLETRYLGAFVTMAMVAPYSAVEFPNRFLAASIAMLGLLWCTLFAQTTVPGGAQYVPWQKTTTNTPWRVASALESMGLRANDKVASVCYSNRRNVFWARLARARIVAETDWNVHFWQLNSAEQQRVLAALGRTGALIAVSDEPPPDPSRATGWRRVGGTSYYEYSLTE